MSQLRAVSHGNAPLQDDAGNVSVDDYAEDVNKEEGNVSTRESSTKDKSSPTDSAAVEASEATIEATTEGVATPLPKPPPPEPTTRSSPPEPLILAPPAAASEGDDIVDLPMSGDAVDQQSQPTSDEMTAGAGGDIVGKTRRISMRRRSSDAASWIIDDSAARGTESGNEVRRRSSLAVPGEKTGDSTGGSSAISKLPDASPQLRSAAIRLNTNLAKVQQKQRRMTMMSGAHDWELHAMAAAASSAATSSSENVAESFRDGQELETKEKEKMVAARRWDFLNEMNPEILSSRLEKAGPTAAARWVTTKNKVLGHSDTDSVHSGSSSVASIDNHHDNDEEEEMTFNVTSPVHAALSGQSPSSGSGHKQFTVSDIIKAFGGGKGSRSSGGRSRRSGDKVDGKTGTSAATTTEHTSTSSSSSSVRPRRRSSLARLDKKSLESHSGGGSGVGGSEEKSGVRRLREIFEKKPRAGEGDDGKSTPPPARLRKHSHASPPSDQSTLPATASEVKSPPNINPSLTASSTTTNDQSKEAPSSEIVEVTANSAGAPNTLTHSSSSSSRHNVRRSLAVFQSSQALAAVKGRLPSGGRGGRGGMGGRGGRHSQQRSQIAGAALSSAADAAADMALTPEDEDGTGKNNANSIKEEGEDGKEDIYVKAKDATISDAVKTDAQDTQDGKGDVVDKEEGEDGDDDGGSSSDGNDDSDGSGSDRSGSSSSSDNDDDDDNEMVSGGGNSEHGTGSNSSHGSSSKGGGSIGAAMFSEAELLSLKLLFAIMDHDGNERIEKEELAA